MSQITYNSSIPETVIISRPVLGNYIRHGDDRDNRRHFNNATLRRNMDQAPAVSLHVIENLKYVAIDPPEVHQQEGARSAAIARPESNLGIQEDVNAIEIIPEEIEVDPFQAHCTLKNGIKLAVFIMLIGGFYAILHFLRNV